jgi:hypothetical protein
MFRMTQFCVLFGDGGARSSSIFYLKIKFFGYGLDDKRGRSSSPINRIQGHRINSFHTASIDSLLTPVLLEVDSKLLLGFPWPIIFKPEATK